MFENNSDNCTRFLEGQKELRKRLVRLTSKQVLIANLSGSHQDEDDYNRTNFNGFGRERVYSNFMLHFDPDQRPGPAGTRFNLSDGKLHTQVFQIAGCDLRCWYCFVDFQLLSGRESRGAWFTAGEMLDLVQKEGNLPKVIELSGGQAELVPEWTLWVMQELKRRDLDGKLAVWTDDNLTSDYFWKLLSPADQFFVRSFPGYSRAVCLKGYDEDSFECNTGYPGALFQRQLDILSRLIAEDFPLVIYLTLVDKPRNIEDVEIKMLGLIRNLEEMGRGTSRKVIPLRMTSFRNMMRRANFNRLKSFGLQKERFLTWKKCREVYDGSN